MGAGITRESALEMLNEHVKNPHMIKHCLASEAVMRAMAKHFDEDEEKWAVACLLHDDVIEDRDLRFF